MRGSRRRFLEVASGLGALTLASGARAVPRRWPKEDEDSEDRLRLGCCAYSLRDLLTAKPPTMDLLGFVDWAAEAGFDGVELTSYYFPPDPDADYLARLRARCEERGIAISGGAIGGDLTGTPEEKAAQLESTRLWLGRYRQLGAPFMRIFAGNAGERTEAEARACVVACIRECLPAAEEAGVVLALENHGGVVATPEGMLEILDRIDSPWLAANLDTGNFHTADPYADLAKIAPFAANVHAKLKVGDQPADWERVVAMLAETDYRGFLSIEHEGATPPLEGVPAQAAQIRAAMAR